MTGCESGHPPFVHRFSDLLTALFVFEISSAVTAIAVYFIVIFYLAFVERLRSTIDVIQLHVCTYFIFDLTLILLKHFDNEFVEWV